MCAPAGPPKIPYSCRTQTRSNVAEIQEIRGLAIRSQLILGKLEANPRGVAVAFFRIVDGQGQQLRGLVFRVDGVTQIRRKRGDAAAPRKVVPDDGNPAWQHGPWMNWPKWQNSFFDNGQGGCRIEAEHFLRVGKGNLRVRVEHVDHCRVFSFRTYFRQCHSILIFVTSPCVSAK
jgi:hypothetical protein